MTKILFLLALIVLAGFQLAFLNSFFPGFNAVLILILFLVLKGSDKTTLSAAWLGGLLLDTLRPSIFGFYSLTFLLLAAVLIFLHQKVFLAPKYENIVILSVLAVILYRVLNWPAASFWSPQILTELLITAAIMLIFGRKNA